MVHHNQQPFAFRSIYFSRNVFSTFLPQVFFIYIYVALIVCVRVGAQYVFFLFSEMIRCSLLSQWKSLYVLVLFGSKKFFFFTSYFVKEDVLRFAEDVSGIPRKEPLNDDDVTQKKPKVLLRTMDLYCCVVTSI